jgi:hypothetical protein
MAGCVGFKRDGSQCTATVEPPQRYCWWHDPTNADKRRRSASRAARSKPSREIKDLKRQLQDLTTDVLDGKVERGNAVVVNQILNTCLRAIELERKIREQDELEERLVTLEQAQEQKGDRRWGA